MSVNSEEKRTLISFDWALKSILRQKDNFDILESFLRTLLNDDKLEIIDLLESESNQESGEDKYNRVDLKAKDGKGREIIIEVQYNREPDYLERIYYGTAKSVVDSMEKGYRYKQVKKVISISIVYFDISRNDYIVKGTTTFSNYFKPEKEATDVNTDIFAEYYIIQPKSDLFDDTVNSGVDEWVYMFKHSEVKDEFTHMDVEAVKEKLDLLKMPTEEQRRYERYLLDKTIQEGVLEVREEEGREKGRIEEKKEIARNFLRMGLSIEQIASGTGLTIEEIEEIKASKN